MPSSDKIYCSFICAMTCRNYNTTLAFIYISSDLGDKSPKKIVIYHESISMSRARIAGPHWKVDVTHYLTVSHGHTGLLSTVTFLPHKFINSMSQLFSYSWNWLLYIEHTSKRVNHMCSVLKNLKKEDSHWAQGFRAGIFPQQIDITLLFLACTTSIDYSLSNVVLCR